MIETRSLRKSFGLRPVLRGVDLEVAPGECLALMGPNGAGKTTLLRILATLSQPTAGSVRVAGLPLPAAAGAVRRRLGVVAHHTLLYSDLTAEENLRFYGRMYGLTDPRPRIARCWSRWAWRRAARPGAHVFARDAAAPGHCPGHAARPPGDDVRRALHRPRPAAGGDAGRGAADGAPAGRTMLLTTHDLARALALADRVAILARGVIVFSAACRGPRSAARAETYAAAVQ